MLLHTMCDHYYATYVLSSLNCLAYIVVSLFSTSSCFSVSQPVTNCEKSVVGTACDSLLLRLIQFTLKRIILYSRKCPLCYQTEGFAFPVSIVLNVLMDLFERLPKL